jgi:hypothetical protein
MSSRSRLLLALAIAALAGCASAADRGPTGPAHAALAPVPQLVTLSLEAEGGGPLPSYFHFGSVFVEGQEGLGYAIRLTNNTAERVEAVVTVDGRDVISGQLGNFKKQRGYVLDPFATIRIDGFRQSFDQVAAFRFSGLQESYTARQGTPQHAGVIGMAVFREKPQRQKKTGPIAVGPGPSTGPSSFPASGDDGRARSGGPFPGSPADEAAPAQKSAEGGAPPPASAPAGEAEDFASAEPSAASRDVGGGGDGGFAPPPEPRNELGTEYGESRFSSVHEVEFKRKKKRKPDEIFAVYYDSRRGLQARGVPVDGAPLQIAPEPQPFPVR